MTVVRVEPTVESRRNERRNIFPLPTLEDFDAAGTVRSRVTGARDRIANRPESDARNVAIAVLGRARYPALNPRLDEERKRARMH